MQSRLSRSLYEGQHTGSIRAVAVDGLSQLLVSGGADSKLVIWHIKTKKVLKSITLDSAVCKMRLHEDSAMVAVGLDDFSLVVVDLETKRVVRRFPGHGGRVTDLAFNPSGKWLVSSSMDSTVCTWDLLTGSLIDRAVSEQVITSMDMSPRGEFLVVSKLDEPGVFIWSNRSLYAHVSLKALSVDGEEVADIEGDFKSAEQISNELVTLSLLPDSRWANLLKLDIIRARNKLKAPPKIRKSAPFFLPTLPGLTPTFDMSQQMAEDEAKSTKQTFSTSSGLDRVLLDCIEKVDAQLYLDLMKTFGVSTIDSEIRCLAADSETPDLLLAFLKVTRMALESHKDYELVQSYLSLFLKLHYDAIMSHDELLEELAAVQTVAETSWKRLDTLFNKARCLVTYQRSAIL